MASESTAEKSKKSRKKKRNKQGLQPKPSVAWVNTNSTYSHYLSPCLWSLQWKREYNKESRA